MESALEIISRKLKNDDPSEGYFKIKNGKIVDYGFGLKKGKTIIHPVSLEGILRTDDGSFEREYLVKVSYNYEDIFDINMYMEYLSKNNLIEDYNSKIKYVDKEKLKNKIFSDLTFIKSIDKLQDYFIEELGISPKVYFKLKRKEKVEELDEKIKVINELDYKLDTKLKELKRVISIYENFKDSVKINSLDKISRRSTGLSFKEIAEQADDIFQVYVNKISEDVANLYLMLYNDKFGYDAVKQIVKIALNRAKENYFSDNLFDYLVINENYNEIKEIFSGVYKKDLTLLA